MSLRDQIVEEALSYVGTPFHDRAMLRGCGVDCSTFPYLVYRAFNLIPEIVFPKVSMQIWLDRKVTYRGYEEWVVKLAKREITESEVQPADFVLWKVVNSWVHGGIVVRWPEFVIHPVNGLGVIGSHGLNEGFLRNRQHRFFAVL